VVEWKRIV